MTIEESGSFTVIRGALLYLILDLVICLVLTVVVGFVFDRWDASKFVKESLVVEPVDPLEGWRVRGRRVLASNGVRAMRTPEGSS